MTFAWYAHLKNFDHKALWIAVIASWSIALFEYTFQVPANRIGFDTAQSVFVPFTIFYMKQALSWNFLYTGICLSGAVYFIFF